MWVPTPLLPGENRVFRAAKLMGRTTTRGRRTIRHFFGETAEVEGFADAEETGAADADPAGTVTEDEADATAEIDEAEATAEGASTGAAASTTADIVSTDADEAGDAASTADTFDAGASQPTSAAAKTSTLIIDFMVSDLLMSKVQMVLDETLIYHSSVSLYKMNRANRKER